jgi:microcystin degradation protein MlrC
MKVLLAAMSHETNTFSPVPTDLKRFGGGRQPLEGEAALNSIRGTGTTMAGLLDAAEQAGATVKTSLLPARRLQARFLKTPTNT